MPDSRRPLSFLKMQAAGNHFVLIDALDGWWTNWSALARRLCAQHIGIGADGLLVVTPSSATAARIPDPPVARMRMYNPDGSEDMCGNGTRCVAAYVRNQHYVTDNRFRIETQSGVHEARTTGKAWRVRAVEVNLGQPRFFWSEIPVSIEMEKVVDYPLKVAGQMVPVTALSTGTTHAIVFTDNLSQITELGPQIMRHPFFPQQASVSFAKVEAPDRIIARVWERGGVGESASCGTGALAILTAAHVKGFAHRQGKVVFPGGTLHVQWDEVDNLWLAGPVEFIFEGVWQ